MSQFLNCSEPRALREKILKQADGVVVEDGTYKGMTGYTDFRAGFRRENNIGAEKGTGAHGPLRAT
jgi:RING finger protein 113A